MEYRVWRHDRVYRWILDIGVPRFNQECFFVGYIGSCVDITDLKLAEIALANVNRGLIEAQEQERTRIARELYDDIGQRLVLLAINLAQLHQRAAHLTEFSIRFWGLEKSNNRDSKRYPNHVAPVALVETRIAGRSRRYEGLLQRIRGPEKSRD